MSIPNFITSLRIAGTICLFFLEPFSPGFYIVYTLCGISDVLDGLIARLTKTTTEFGAKLDSIADIMFYMVMLLRIFPVLWEVLPGGIWYVVAGVLVIRCVSYITAAVKYKRFSAQHTYLNKLTGVAVFSVPYFLTRTGDVIVCFAVCVIAGLASLEEFLIHLLSKEYNSKRKTLFFHI